MRKKGEFHAEAAVWDRCFEIFKRSETETVRREDCSCNWKTEDDSGRGGNKISRRGSMNGGNCESSSLLCGVKPSNKKVKTNPNEEVKH